MLKAFEIEIKKFTLIPINNPRQTLDMQNSALSSVDLSRFTLPNYSAIVKYKTSAYSFYLPIAAGLLASGHDPNDQKLKDILMEMGHYFQVQDDFLDCFGDPTVTGKVGTDIQVGRNNSMSHTV